MNDFCIVEDCGRRAPVSPKSHRSQQICHQHWNALSLDLKLEFWRATRYSLDAAPIWLQRRISEVLRQKVET